MSMLPKPPVCPHCGNAEIARANLRLAASEKRMREVAEEIGVASERFCWGEDAVLLRTWRAKLLEGLGESASKKEDAGT